MSVDLEGLVLKEILAHQECFSVQVKYRGICCELLRINSRVRVVKGSDLIRDHGLVTVWITVGLGPG